MYVELASLDKMSNEKQNRDIVFVASQLSLNGVSVLPNYLAETKQYVPDMVLSTPIDYPDGTGESEVRTHAAISAIRHGANTIDLVMNCSLVVNKKIDKMISDVEAVMEVCRQRNATLRIMMEYRAYEDAEMLFEVIRLLNEMGVEYIFPATGFRLDNFNDNLIAAKIIMDRSNMKVITNGNVVSKEQYEIIKKSGVFGVRFTSVPIVKQIFGV